MLMHVLATFLLKIQTENQIEIGGSQRMAEIHMLGSAA